MVEVNGLGSVSIVPAGWDTPGQSGDVSVVDDKIVTSMNGRAYFAWLCTPGVYDRNKYLGINFLGKTVHYTIDLSQAECGCNAAFYLTSMRQNRYATSCKDYYCDAHKVCGEACTEIDIQEANRYAFLSTLHAATDWNGQAGGFGGGGDAWSGPRDWNADDYGPGARCIDTMLPFAVDVSFPTDTNGDLLAMEVDLSQPGSPCSLSVGLVNYTVPGNDTDHDGTQRRGSVQRSKGMAEMTAALRAGMTPVVSFWKSEKMLWLDGEGADGQGHCTEDAPKTCGDSIIFGDFSIAPYDSGKHPIHKQSSTTASPPATKSPSNVPDSKAILIVEAQHVPSRLSGEATLELSTGTGIERLPVQIVGEAKAVGGGDPTATVAPALSLDLRKALSSKQDGVTYVLQKDSESAATSLGLLHTATPSQATIQILLGTVLGVLIASLGMFAVFLRYQTLGMARDWVHSPMPRLQLAEGEEATWRAVLHSP